MDEITHMCKDKEGTIEGGYLKKMLLTTPLAAMALVGQHDSV